MTTPAPGAFKTGGIGESGDLSRGEPLFVKSNVMEHKHSKWDEVPLEPMSDVISRRIFTGEKVMTAQVYFKKGAVVPLHSHESEQITYILKGALKFELQDKEVVVHEGEVLHIPSNVPHRAIALEDTVDLDVFSPIRLDWVNKADEYLRRGERETAP